MKSFAALLLLCLPAAAQEWEPLDPRSRGMGNTGIAVAEGPVASWWNPANLAQGSVTPLEFLSSGFGFSVHGSGDVSLEGDILGTVDRVTDLYRELGGGSGFQAVQNRLNAGTATAQDLREAVAVIDAVSDLGAEGVGARALGGAALELRLGSFGVFYRDVTSGGVDPFFDFGSISALSSTSLATFFGQFAGGALSAAGTALSSRIQAETTLGAADNDTDTVLDADELAFQAQQSVGDAGISDPTFQENYLAVVNATVANAGGSSGNTLYSNGSGIEISGIRLRETGVSLGLPLHLIALPGIPSLNLGVALKEVIGETFREVITLRDLQDGSDALEEALKNKSANTTRSNKFNIDAGLSIRPIQEVTLALGGRNLLDMDFDVEGTTEDFHVRPQYRIGLATTALGFATLAVDYDLTKNDFDGLDGYESQLLSAGLELKILFLNLRLGTFTNLESDESDPVYAAGLGFDIFGLKIDVGGQISSAKQEVEVDSSGTGSEEIPERVAVSAGISLDLRF